jgi:hypothetical protein
MPPNRPGIHYSQCEQCRRPICHAVVCPVCGRSCCRWGCYTHHVARHRASRAGQPEAPHRVETDPIGREALVAS